MQAKSVSYNPWKARKRVTTFFKEAIELTVLSVLVFWTLVLVLTCAYEMLKSFVKGFIWIVRKTREFCAGHPAWASLFIITAIIMICLALGVSLS